MYLLLVLPGCKVLVTNPLPVLSILIHTFTCLKRSTFSLCVFSFYTYPYLHLSQTVYLFFVCLFFLYLSILSPVSNGLPFHCVSFLSILIHIYTCLKRSTFSLCVCSFYTYPYFHLSQTVYLFIVCLNLSQS